MRIPAVDDCAHDLVRRLLARPATLGAGRLLCVDGPAGSGKTTLAAAVRREARDALRGPGPARRDHVELVHMDNLFAGWAGLHAGVDTLVTDVVGPLRSGEPGRYRRYDWLRHGWAEEHTVGPAELVVVEGVGSGAAAIADVTTLLVWVDTPAPLRLERGLARDGDLLRHHWLAWADSEAAVFARERTRERADVVVSGVSAVAAGPARSRTSGSPR